MTDARWDYSADIRMITAKDGRYLNAEDLARYLNEAALLVDSGQAESFRAIAAGVLLVRENR